MPCSAKSFPVNRRFRPSRQPRVQPLAFNTAPGLVASQLMGTNNGLTLPRLDGVPAEHHLVVDAQRAIPLAASLVSLNIAPAKLWKEAKQDPITFIQLALADWIKARGGEAIRKRFTYHATLTSCVDEFAQEDKQKDNRLYLTLETESAGYAVLGPTFQLLETIDPRLPR